MRNVKRSYDASGRRARALERRERVVASAHALFLRDGFAATTVGAVAERAGVSTPTVYKAFGGKAGLVRAVWSSALAGEGPVPAETRSDAMSGAARSGRDVIEGWLRLALEVAPRAGPVLAVVRQAAHVDPAAAELLSEIDAGRAERMRRNAEVLAARGDLHPDLTVGRATDLLLVFSGEFYGPLVSGADWSLDEYVRTMTRTMAAALLRHPG